MPRDLAYFVRQVARVRTPDLSRWLHNLGLMQKAGIDLVRTLEILTEQESNPRLRHMSYQMLRQVMTGSSLASACLLFPRVFPPSVLLLIQTADQTGDYAGRAEQAALLLDRQYALENQVRQALSAPGVTMVTCTLLIFIVVRTILPRLLTLFDTLQAHLPLVTRLVVLVVDVVNSPVFLLGVFGVVLFFALYWDALKQTGLCLMLMIPMTRRMVGGILAISFCDVVGRLYADGVPLTAAFDNMAKTAGFHYHARLMARAGHKFRTEGHLVDAVALLYYFPAVVLEMLMIGEETGALTECLNAASRLLNEEIQDVLGRVVAMMEPLAMGLVGGMMLFFILGVFMPIYQLLQAIH